VRGNAGVWGFGERGERYLTDLVCVLFEGRGRKEGF